MSLRVIFMGTPEFSVPTLSEIIGAGHDVCAVYTRAPKPAGRGMKETRSPVHVFADKLGIPVIPHVSLRSAPVIEEFRALQADVAVVVAYGLLLPQEILDGTVHGCYNVHASLLPRWRGAAPIQRAIMQGDTMTGVGIMKMDIGLDTGAVAMQEAIPISDNDTAQDIHDRLSHLGADLMHRALGALERGGLSLVNQDDSKATYAAKITAADSRINWNCSARNLHNQVRGLSPFPGAWCNADLGKGEERLKILQTEPVDNTSGSAGKLLDSEGVVGCGEGALKLVTVQRAGKSPMKFSEFALGARLSPDFTFS